MGGALGLDACHGLSQSRTWDGENGSALVHGKHVGASAHIGASVLWLRILDGQDAVEIHGAIGQLAIALASPDQSVGW